jgi:hypothetical protein
VISSFLNGGLSSHKGCFLLVDLSISFIINISIIYIYIYIYIYIPNFERALSQINNINDANIYIVLFMSNCIYSPEGDSELLTSALH